ncbi:MAG: chemotaxis protein CheW [Bdellovibrionales bacterium]|nr:chemotaxis protein CheW [Bdellovibrionales bacterium]
MNEDFKELLEDFVTESLELLSEANNALIELEKSPHDKKQIDCVFRGVHSIKGAAALMGLSKIEELSHLWEELLNKIREGSLHINENLTDTFLMAADILEKILLNLKKTGDEGNYDISEVLELFKNSFNSEKIKSETRESVPQKITLQNNSPSSTASMEIIDSHIKVDINTLDKIMNLISELALTRNQLITRDDLKENLYVSKSLKNLNTLTSDLQQMVMKTRMQPISTLWNRYPKMIRDLSKNLGKKISIKMEGQETELDRSLIEAIKDPLVHLIRNAADHAIEMPEERTANSKQIEGEIILRAYHKSGKVNIEIQDDGKGISLESVKKKAIDKNLYTSEELEKLSDKEILDIIFMPGFSTKDQATTISGRGVGMDVVKTNIQAIGGTIELNSIMGKGACVKIKVPLTLSILPALIVKSADNTFAIPQTHLVELIHIKEDKINTIIEEVNGSLVLRSRGKLLPLISLQQITSTKNFDKTELVEDQDLKVVVLQSDEKLFALIVDEISDTLEIVVKPLDRLLQHIPIYSGVTIVGQDTVGLIVDVGGLAKSLNLSKNQKDISCKVNDEDYVNSKNNNFVGLVTFLNSNNNLMALPIEDISRIEKINTSIFQKIGNKAYIHYNEKILPVFNLSDIFDELKPTAAEDSITLLIYEDVDFSFGIVVDKLSDILTVNQDSYIKDECRLGVDAKLVINNKIIEVIDLSKFKQLVNNNNNTAHNRVAL